MVASEPSRQQEHDPEKWKPFSEMIMLKQNVRLSSDTISSDQSLKPEHHFGPVQDHIAVEELEHRLLLRNRVMAGDDRGDDHIATLVEGERQHRFRQWRANRIAAAAALHPVHCNGPAGAECRTFTADEIDVADTIELLVVGHTGLTIAEADFRPQIEIDVNPASGRVALVRPPLPPLVDGEGPRGFGPDRLTAMCIGRRLCGAEEHVAADSGDQHDGGNGCDPLDHFRSSTVQASPAAKLVFAIEE